jgi:ATP-dependent DNA helicase RecQ
VPPYVVFSDATLIEMATYLPQIGAEMRRISGVGDLKFDKYGADFLREIVNYCRINNLESRIDLKTPKREPKQRTRRDSSGNDTYSVTFNLFKSGMSVQEIARAREMATSTIETHLARFVQSGEIKLDDLVHERKIEPIRNAIIQLNTGTAIGPVKEFLGADFSYMEIKAFCVLNLTLCPSFLNFSAIPVGLIS